MSDETAKTDLLGNITFPGHIGTIFKSDNAVYLGCPDKSIEYLFSDGSVLSNRSFSKLVNNESGWNYMARKFESYGASQWQAHNANGAFTSITDSRAGNKTPANCATLGRSIQKLHYLKVFLTSASGLMKCNENFFNEGTTD